MQKPVISIIGYGRLGQHLTHWLLRSGYTIGGIFNRSTLPMHPDVFQARHQGIRPETAEELGDLTLICVPDNQIRSVANHLSTLDLSHKRIIHTSGALGSDVLSTLRDRGAYTASMHPLQTFGPLGTTNPFKGIYVSLEGDWFCIEHLLELVKALGATPHQTDIKGKTILHLACVWASNYVHLLLHAATAVGQEGGLAPQKTLTLLKPILEQTLQNALSLGPLQALTGPASRGDLSTLQHHLELLQDPQWKSLYTELALFAADLAVQRGSLGAHQYQHLRASLHPSPEEP